MTLAQIQHEFHGDKSDGLPAGKLAEHRNNKIKTTFDNVCRRFKLTKNSLLLIPPKELARMVKVIDEKLQVDETGVSAAAKVYVGAA